MVIATGTVVKVIENARTSAFLSSYEMVLKTVKDNVAMANMGLMNSDDIICSCELTDSNNCYDKYGLSSDDYSMLIESDGYDGYIIQLEGTGKFKNISIFEDELSSNVINYSSSAENSNVNSIYLEMNASGEIIAPPDNVQSIAERKLVSDYYNDLNNITQTLKQNIINNVNAENIICSSNTSATNNCYDKYGLSSANYKMIITGNSTIGYQFQLERIGKIENISVSEDKLPVGVINYSASSDSSKINSVYFEINTNGSIIEYTEEEKENIKNNIQDVTQKELFIEYSNLLIEIAETYHKEGITAAKKLYNSHFTFNSNSFTAATSICSEGILISNKRTKDSVSKYGTDKINVANIGSLKDERICYYKTNNNTVMTCVKEDGTLYKPDKTSNCY